MHGGSGATRRKPKPCGEMIEAFQTKGSGTWLIFRTANCVGVIELDGPQNTVRHLQEAARSGQLRPEDFQPSRLGRGAHSRGATVGQQSGSAGRRGAPGGLEGVDVTAFLQVAGQLIYTKILEAYRSEVFVLSRLVQTIPTRLDGERIPGVGRLGDVAAEIHPGMPYPHVGLSEDYIETPSTSKHGLIVPITREALFFDRTGLVLRRAAEVGQILGLSKEKRIIDTVIGATRSYRWNGQTYDTYFQADQGGPWVNALAGNPWWTGRAWIGPKRCLPRCWIRPPASRSSCKPPQCW